MPLGKWRWGRVCVSVCVYICVWGRDKVAAALRNLKAVPICPLRPGLACSAAAAADDADGNSKRKCTFHTQNPFPNQQQQQQRDVEKDVGATTKKRQATTTTAIDDDDDDDDDDD